MSGIGDQMEGMLPPPRRSLHDLIRDRRNTHNKNEGASNLEHDSVLDMPQIGLLYRTLVYSPIMKWIFPARLRSSTYNDIIFVGEEFVHVKQIIPNGEFLHIALKANFSSRIRAANILGKVVDVEDTSLDDVFTPIKDEMDISSGISSIKVTPPQLLVLAMESGELLFLYLKMDLQSNSFEFVESHKPMPKGESMACQPGRYIAVDQRNNLMAVAAHTNTIMIYKIKDWDELFSKVHPQRAEETASHAKEILHDWSPIYHEQAFRVNRFDPDATILGVSFLNHPEDMESTSLLIIVLRSKNRTKIFLYQGNENTGLNFDSPAINGQALEEGASHPNLIIPSLNSSNFFLICETRIYSFINVLTQSLDYTSHDTNPVGDPSIYPQQSFSSDNLPVFTSWVHASRSKNARTIRESIYLLREDGLLLNVSEEGSGSFNLSWSIAARLECNASSALASILLNNSLKDPDTLVAGGCVSDGQMIQIGSRLHENKPDKRIDAMKPKVLQVLPNWSPVIDFAIASSDPNTNEKAMFMTTGRQPHAYVSEMRLGYEARVKYTAYLGDSDMSVGTGLWGLRLPSLPRSILYFVSLLDYTEVFYLDYSLGEALSLEQLEEPTLSVSLVRSDLILRVSPDHIRLYRVISQNDSEDSEIRIEEVLATKDGESGKLAISFAVPPLQAALIVREMNPNDCRLALCGIEGDESPTWKLKTSTETYGYSPTCMTLFEHHEFGSLALLGGSEGIHDCIKLDWEIGPSRLSHFIDFALQNILPSMVAESIVVIPFSQTSDQIEYFILCGYRGGHIDLKRIDFNGNSWSSHHYERAILGTRPVTLSSDPAGPPIAFAVCGDQTLRISLATVHGETRLCISNVWFNDAFNLNYPQPQLPVLQVDSTFHDDAHISDSSSYISVFSDRNLFISKVNGIKAVVPRKIRLAPKPPINENDALANELHIGENEPGTPHLVVPLKTFDVLVVASSRWEVIFPTSYSTSPGERGESRRPKASRKGQRLWRGILYFVDRSIRRGGLDGQVDESQDEDTTICVPFSAGERILAVCEWNFRIYGSDRGAIPHVIVGTSVQSSSDKEARKGKLYFIQLNMKYAKIGDILVTNVKKIDKPVRALAVMDDYRLVVCHDAELSIYGLRSDPDK
jgi:Mono-functional DNA-alkylating methyl methanesulfonate N-term